MQYEMGSSYTGFVIGTREIAFNNEVNPTTIWAFLTAIGLLLPFGLASYVSLIRRKRFDGIFVILLALLPIVMYLMSVNGILSISKLRFAYTAPYVFWGILAAYGIRGIIRAIPSTSFRPVVKAVILMLFLANAAIGLYGYWFPMIAKPTNFYSNMYIGSDYLNVMQYMNTHVPHYAHVMTQFHTGMFVPAFTDVRVYVGNEMSTVDVGRKEGISNTFYWSGLSFDQVVELFKRDSISYVLWDVQQPPQGYDAIMKPVYQSGGITLYKVELE
jgi:hypothetical protein